MPISEQDMLKVKAAKAKYIEIEPGTDESKKAYVAWHNTSVAVSRGLTDGEKSDNSIMFPFHMLPREISLETIHVDV
jgi:hypothetical protein